MVDRETARELALALPGAEECDHFGSPSYRVNGKIFAQLSSRASGEGRLLVKLTAADQTALIMSAPDTFLSAPHWGRHGWTHIQLATVEASVLGDLLRRSWQLAASRRLAATTST